ncbi:HEPN domain-containing protein [Leptospira ognonensis]|uniref:HEPN domain-containing protein n=1 Tax=Leptospira ognonensis TaxID=2484945 RepID=A0A4R9K349_9LEPT|nr:HEPN domain-containing protein [Leptospira ognonensis]TGL58667.1 HEPN domain-containing protein [Leptospira ognonensis]
MGSNRYLDWFRQAENDWEWGNHSLEAGHYSQTCFIAQQVAEKALKAFCFFKGFDIVKTHSVRKIAQELEINGEIEAIAKELDLFYIPTRYPDSLPEGAPFESFTQAQAKHAMDQSMIILNFVRSHIQTP